MTIRALIPFLIMLIVSITVYHWLDRLLHPRPRRRCVQRRRRRRLQQQLR